MIVFSGYWKVENNPKKSNKVGHLSSAKSKQFDLFFCEQEVELDCKQHILPYADLPAHKYIQNLNPKKACSKVGLSMPKSVFQQLCTIWCSKILLFNVVAKMYPHETEFMWKDCVENKKIDIIQHSSANNLIIGKYDKVKNRHLFGGAINKNTVDTLLCAQVIKMHRDFIPVFTKAYINELQHIDKTMTIYDEEIVLSMMHKQNPQLFTVV